MLEAGKTQEFGCSSPSQVQDAADPLFPFPKSMKIGLHLGKLLRDFSDVPTIYFSPFLPEWLGSPCSDSFGSLRE